MKNQKFDSRSGCLDYGNSYEFLMAAFYGLHLSLSEKITDFKMSTNNNDMGNFDDVVLEIKYEDGDEHLYALQLKHRGTKEDAISTQAFDAEKGKFGLKKYCAGFKEIEKNFDSIKASYNIPFEKFHFILYTNQVLPNFHTHDKNHKKIVADELTLKSKEATIYRYDKCIAKNLLNLSEADSFFIYKFRIEPGGQLNENFLKQFLLYTKQKDAQEMECRISKLIWDIFNNCDATVVTNYLNFFKMWWRGDFGKFKLTKRDIMLKLAEYVLTSSIPNVDFKKIQHYGKKSDLLNKCFSNFDLTIVRNSGDKMEEKIWGAILKEHFSDVDQCLLWSQPLPDVEKTFLPKDTQIPISAQGENFIDQSLRKIYTIFWHKGKLPLFVKVTDNFRKGVYAAIKLCENHKQKMKFVVMDTKFVEGEFSEDLKIFNNLSDLSGCDDVYNKLCKELTVSLQGRQRITLKDLLEINSSFDETISTQEIIQMLDGNFVISTDCKKTFPKHYVHRLTPKILLDSKAIDEIKDSVVVVSCQKVQKYNFKTVIYDLNKYLLLKQSGSVKQFPDKFVILVNGLCTKQQFNEICVLNNSKNCHHVQMMDNDKIEWLQSQGSVSLLRPYQINIQDLKPNDLIEDSDLLNYFSNRINVICAAPGMGKSIMLEFLKQKCPSDHWVISINFNDHVKFFKEQRSVDEALDYFLKIECKNNFVADVLKFFRVRKKLLFLWDAFDELPVSCNDYVITLIKMLTAEGYWQWISARSNSRELLEDMLNLCSLTITPFNEEDQQNFIYNNLKEKYDDEEKVLEMVSKLNENMSSSLSCGYFDYSGVPLQIYMIMEIFLKNPQKYLAEFKIVILTDIYQEFTDGKFINLFERASANKNNYLMQKIQKKFKKTQLPLYEMAALKASFDDKIFSSLDIDCEKFLQEVVTNRDSLGLIFGLNDENKPIFTHKTYEEFLTASWLAKNYHNYPDLIQAIFYQEYRNIRLMFDMILAKDSPIHVAVIYQNLSILKKYENDVSTSKDKGGRNPLQIACAWGSRHPVVNTFENDEGRIVISAEETIVDSEENVEIVNFLLSHGCDPFEKDNLISCNAIEYSDRTLSLSSLEVVLMYHHQINLTELENFCDINTVLYYSIIFNYKSLFYQLPSYPYVDVILKGEEARTLLQFAIKMDRLDFVETLLNFVHYQKVINQPYKDLGSSLFSAASAGNLEMYKLLRSKGAELGRNQTSPLITAVAFGLKKFCQYLLLEGANPNECNVDGNSVLQIAAMKNHVDIMKLLLSHGAEVNYVTYFDITALEYGIDNKSLEVVQLLLENGADVNRQGKKLYGYTPLHSACELGEYEIVKLLLKADADTTIKSNRLYTPLHVALINKQEGIAKIIIEANYRVINDYTEEASTPIMLASLQNFYDVVDILADLGADVDSMQSNDSPLRIATLKNFDRCVAVLLKAGASVNKADTYGFTPLFYAIRNETIMKLFLDHPGTDVNVKSKSGVTPLHFAVENGEVPAVQMLIKHKAHIDATDLNMNTPLHYAIRQKHAEVVKFLLANQASFSDGISFLTLACISDAPDCLLTLLSYGIDVNLQDEEARTALHFAALNSLFCVKLLSMKGADVNACDKHGFSPLSFAVFIGKIDMMTELIERGADTRIGFGSSSALHLSAGIGDVFGLLLLLNAGCDINAQDENGRTPLHCAAEGNCGFSITEIIKCLASCKIKIDPSVEYNFEDCINELLQRGASILIRNNSGRTPIFSAAFSNQFNIIKLFSEKFKAADDLEEEWQLCVFVAAANNYLKILQFLHESKVGDICRTAKGSCMTVLHYACAKGSYECVDYLINNGADINAENVDGCTPLYLCASIGNLDLVKLLVANDAKVDVSNGHGNTSLFTAAAQGFPDIVAFLHDNGADINVVDNDGDTPLHDAAAMGHKAVVQYLILKNADMILNKNGKRPIDLAKDNGKHEVVAIMQEN